MAELKSLLDGAGLPVGSRLLVGRSAACGLRLDNQHVSGEHATVSWTGGHWAIRDLGSRNGTYVDGVRIDPGHAVKLRAGQRIAFGDPEQAWEIADDGPPSIIAVNTQTHRVQAGQGDLLVLPNPDRPEVSIYAEADGWRIDIGDGRPTPFADRSIVETSDGPWRVELPAAAEGTPLMQLQLSMTDVELSFEVSRDEEFVRITIRSRGADIPLLPREHAYVLLTLARARMDDAHLPVHERGWRDRDQLERMLALDSNALNVSIHRARQQLSAAGIQGAAGIVEVRRKQRRLGTDRFRILSLGAS